MVNKFQLFFEDLLLVYQKTHFSLKPYCLLELPVRKTFEEIHYLEVCNVVMNGIYWEQPFI